jgi:hypothetical protein
MTGAVAADGLASGVRFAGRTSQRRPISFTLAGGAITHLQYRIVDRCPGGRLLFVHDWGFPALPVKDSVRRHVRCQASAEGDGRRVGHGVGTHRPRNAVGSYPESQDAQVLHWQGQLQADGATTVTSGRRGHRLAPAIRRVWPLGVAAGRGRWAAGRDRRAPGLRAFPAGITMPRANERPPRPKNTSKFRTSWIPESALTVTSSGLSDPLRSTTDTAR